MNVGLIQSCCIILAKFNSAIRSDSYAYSVWVIDSPDCRFRLKFSIGIILARIKSAANSCKHACQEDLVIFKLFVGIMLGF